MSSENPSIEKFIPVWDRLEDNDKKIIIDNVVYKNYKKGDIVHGGSENCTGLVFVTKGKLRAYIVFENGKEISLYYLLQRDVCLMSASCVMKDIDFDITVEAMEDTSVIIIPTFIYDMVEKKSAPMANYVNTLMASRFSDIIWLLEQVMVKRFDLRLAEFLLFHMKDNRVDMTHEQIANHLGSAREVVSRMLKHFLSDGFIRLYRGGIEIINEDELHNLCS